MASEEGRPSRRVVESFGALGDARALAGGQRPVWRVGATVLKRLDMPAAAPSWQADLLRRLDGRPDFRVSPPLLSAEGSLVVEGWTAWRLELGKADRRRISDNVAAGEALHAALLDETKPVLADRRDRWAIADRAAWAELPVTAADGLIVHKLAAARRPIAGRNQLIHGDLTGNVMFEPSLPPLIIDLSVYWRPVLYASAIVVADALIAGHVPATGIKTNSVDPDFPQCLLRALLFRALSEPDGVDVEATYGAAAEAALGLVG